MGCWPDVRGLGPDRTSGGKTATSRAFGPSDPGFGVEKPENDLPLAARERGRRGTKFPASRAVRGPSGRAVRRSFSPMISMGVWDLSKVPRNVVARDPP